MILILSAILCWVVLGLLGFGLANGAMCHRLPIGYLITYNKNPREYSNHLIVSIIIGPLNLLASLSVFGFNFKNFKLGRPSPYELLMIETKEDPEKIKEWTEFLIRRYNIRVVK